MGRRMSFADDDGLVVVRAEVESLRVVGGDFFTIAVCIHAQGDGEKFIAAGRMFGVQAGSTLELKGRWVDHPKHGRQFKVTSLDVVLSDSTTGVVRWLAERMPGIGRGRATKLVERFGVPGVWDVIEKEPHRLAEIDGVALATVTKIVEAYKAERADRERMVRFKDLGLTDSQVSRIIERWGDDAEQRMRDNPYALAEEIHGFGFKRADEIARRMGLPLDAPARLRAGLAYMLGEARQQGHVFVVAGKLVAMTAIDCLGIAPQPVWLQLYELVKEERLVRHGSDDAPGKWRVYTVELDDAEETVADFVRRAA